MLYQIREHLLGGFYKNYRPASFRARVERFKVRKPISTTTPVMKIPIQTGFMVHWWTELDSKIKSATEKKVVMTKKALYSRERTSFQEKEFLEELHWEYRGKKAGVL